MNIIITANSPGELYGWARPLAKRLKKVEGEFRIILVLLPCVFSSGSEEKVALEMNYIDVVVSSGEYLKFFLLKRPLKAFADFPPQVIVHLGGDLLHSAMMARRFNIPALAYKWANKMWDRYFIKYFVPHNKFKDLIIKQGIKEDKVEVVGQLVADEVLDELSEGARPEISGNPVICFMPGSRTHEIKCLTQFFMRIAELITKDLPSASFILPLSSFVSEEFLLKSLSAPPPKGFLGSTAELVQEEGKKYLRSREGCKVLLYFGGGSCAIAASDFLLTIPGTKTLQSAVLGKPMLVIVPLNRTDFIPFHGVIGMLDFIPCLGPIIKGKILLTIARKFGFTSLPNILAQREIVPEMVDILTPEMVTGRVLELLKNKSLLDSMSQELKMLYASTSGASDRVVALIKEICNR